MNPPKPGGTGGFKLAGGPLTTKTIPVKSPNEEKKADVKPVTEAAPAKPNLLSAAKKEEQPKATESKPTSGLFASKPSNGSIFGSKAPPKEKP